MGRIERDEYTEMVLVGNSDTEANGTALVTLNVGTASSGGGHAIAPAGVTTSTVAKWLKVEQDGTTYYVPMWT